MGLKDTHVMSAVSAHDVNGSRHSSAGSKTSSSRGRPMTSETDREFSREFDNLTMENNDGGFHRQHSGYHRSDTAGADTQDDTEYNDDDVYVDDSGDDTSDWERDESRLSRALTFWMPDYVIRPLPRQGHTARQPVFSARLGEHANIRRASSSDSIDTALSLFSCSSHGSRAVRERRRRRVRRRKTASADRNRKAASSAGTGSRWVELAKRRKGALDHFMMANTTALNTGVNLTDESEAFSLCDPDEQKALFRCGRYDAKHAFMRLRKSGSVSNIADTKRATRQRTASFGETNFFGPPLDFQELRKQMMNRRLNSLTGRGRSGRRSLRRSLSKRSLESGGSSDVFFSVAASPPALDGASPRLARRMSRRASEMVKERVSMWKGDSEILAIDLKKELTSKVKQRISITTTALERVTGVGDHNEQRPYTCHLAEFPSHVDDDFALHPKIVQKIRISPHLSDVIKGDINLRMGRPRYHEIRVQDLVIWNRGQTLDRAHRNLKVFNWLHSLQEKDFDLDFMVQEIVDVPPNEDDVTFGDMVLIKAVDDPDIKPLYQHKKTYIK